MEGVPTYLLTQGVLGIVTLVLGYVVIRLYNKTERLENEKSELLKLQLHDSVEQTRNVTAVLSDNSQNMRILSEKIEVGKQIERSER
jgi:C4-type Zn-finger protein